MPIRSARIELLPWAILANGPAWTSAGVFSSVWKRLGLMASFISTVIAPAAFKSSAVTGSRLPVLADDDATEAGPHVAQTGGQRQDGHDFRRPR